MDFFETAQKRLSIRKFTPTAVSEEVMIKALQAAVLAPNSSNLQTWNFHWVKSPEKKQALIPLCLNQSAARTANQLVVVSCDPVLWKRSRPQLMAFMDQVNAPKMVKVYYEKLIPYVYRWGYFNTLAPFKWILTSTLGLFRPMARGPHSLRDLQEVCIKSAALACENFVLALTAQGYASCMMEGFDEKRVKKLLQLRSGSSRIVMVIAVGEEGPRGTWGPRFRIPFEEVLHCH